MDDEKLYEIRKIANLAMQNNPNIIDMGDGLYVTRKKSKILNIE
jgi:predicted nucleotidyltransferase